MVAAMLCAVRRGGWGAIDSNTLLSYESSSLRTLMLILTHVLSWMRFLFFGGVTSRETPAA